MFHLKLKHLAFHRCPSIAFIVSTTLKSLKSKFKSHMHPGLSLTFNLYQHNLLALRRPFFNRKNISSTLHKRKGKIDPFWPSSDQDTLLEINLNLELSWKGQSFSRMTRLFFLLHAKPNSNLSHFKLQSCNT